MSKYTNITILILLYTRCVINFFVSKHVVVWLGQSFNFSPAGPLYFLSLETLPLVT